LGVVVLAIGCCEPAEDLILDEGEVEVEDVEEEGAGSFLRIFFCSSESNNLLSSMLVCANWSAIGTPMKRRVSLPPQSGPSNVLRWLNVVDRILTWSTLCSRISTIGRADIMNPSRIVSAVVVVGGGLSSSGVVVYPS
jgi:hypothetical protein